MSEYDKDGFDKYGYHRIHLAAAKGETKVLQKELDAGVSVDIECRGRYTAGQTPLYRAAVHSNTEAMKLLIERKANLNKTDKDGWSPLMIASKYGHEQAVELLLQHNAGTTIRATCDWENFKAGQTALDIAKAGGKNEVVALLEAHETSLSSAKSPSSVVKAVAISPASAIKAQHVHVQPVKLSNPEVAELTALFTTLKLSDYLQAFIDEEAFVSDLPKIEKTTIEKLIPKVCFLFLRCLLLVITYTFSSRLNSRA